MNKKTWLVVVALVLILLVASYWESSQSKLKPTTEAIKIGAVLSSTGSAATDGLNIKRGIELAQEDLAKKGVVVEIIYQDDGTEPKRTVSAIQQLVSTERPLALIGPTWSFLEDAAGPVIASAKIVAYAPANTSEFVSVASPYQFQGAPRNALKEEPVANWLMENSKKNVAIIVDKTGWGASNAAAFRAAASDAGATVVIDETVQPFGSDVGNTISTILAKAKAANADVILWTGYEPEATALVQKRETLGFNVPILAASSVYGALISRGVLKKEQLAEVYAVEVPPADEFVEKFTAKYGEAPGSYADRAYDGLMVLVEAIQNAPSTDADALAAYLRSDLHYKGYGGIYEFNENGDVKGGEWVIQPVAK